jgi:hypothetical protein
MMSDGDGHVVKEQWLCQQRKRTPSRCCQLHGEDSEGYGVESNGYDGVKKKDSWCQMLMVTLLE